MGSRASIPVFLMGRNIFLVNTKKLYMGQRKHAVYGRNIDKKCLENGQVSWFGSTSLHGSRRNEGHRLEKEKRTRSGSAR